MPNASENLGKTTESQRFVLLFHQTSAEFTRQTGRNSHWDLMLECQQSLKSYSFDEHPLESLDRYLLHSLDSDGQHPAIPKAIATPDHRLEYLEYEGPVSNNRGWVRRELAGTFRWILNSPGRVVVELKFEGVKRTLEFRVKTGAGQL